MSEYIDRELLEAELNNRLSFLNYTNGKYDPYTNGFDNAVTIVKNFQSADVVEVVRCKDCKYYVHNNIFNAKCWDLTKGFIAESKNPYDFCSYGERRQEK